jgi:mRNA interferase RelE/StbE
MKYNIIIANEKIWLKDLRKLPRKEQTKMLDEIINIAERPWQANLNIKKLKNYPVADYRFRIGDYRVLFDVFDDEKEIVLYRLLHRSKLY